MCELESLLELHLQPLKQKLDHIEKRLNAFCQLHPNEPAPSLRRRSSVYRSPSPLSAPFGYRKRRRSRKRTETPESSKELENKTERSEPPKITSLQKLTVSETVAALPKVEEKKRRHSAMHKKITALNSEHSTEKKRDSKNTILKPVTERKTNLNAEKDKKQVLGRIATLKKALEQTNQSEAQSKVLKQNTYRPRNKRLLFKELEGVFPCSSRVTSSSPCEKQKRTDNNTTNVLVTDRPIISKKRRGKYEN